MALCKASTLSANCCASFFVAVTQERVCQRAGFILLDQVIHTHQNALETARGLGQRISWNTSLARLRFPDSRSKKKPGRQDNCGYQIQRNIRQPRAKT